MVARIQERRCRTPTMWNPIEPGWWCQAFPAHLPMQRDQGPGGAGPWLSQTAGLRGSMSYMQHISRRSEAQGAWQPVAHYWSPCTVAPAFCAGLGVPLPGVLLRMGQHSAGLSWVPTQSGGHSVGDRHGHCLPLLPPHPSALPIWTSFQAHGSQRDPELYLPAADPCGLGVCPGPGG